MHPAGNPGRRMIQVGSRRRGFAGQRFAGPFGWKFPCAKNIWPNWKNTVDGRNTKQPPFGPGMYKTRRK